MVAGCSRDMALHETIHSLCTYHHWSVDAWAWVTGLLRCAPSAYCDDRYIRRVRDILMCVFNIYGG